MKTKKKKKTFLMLSPAAAARLETGSSSGDAPHQQSTTRDEQLGCRCFCPGLKPRRGGGSLLVFL
ncbi:uncharacterized protein V6R79_013718 [Siganus canaliculatus]